jgi:quercetin dioxygenase-like cupin family protein
MAIHYTRFWSDSTGESHFEDDEITFASSNFAPPAPPLDVSAFAPAQQVGFVRMAAGWYGDWHPAPRRQFMFNLAGEVEVQVSDGEVRTFRPGDVVLLEDTTGKGHTTRIVSPVDLVMAVVQVPALVDHQVELVIVLRAAQALVTQPGNDFAWSSWEDARAANAELSRYIDEVQTGDFSHLVDMGVIFAPTGPLQEVSLSSGWGREFIDLSSRFDVAHDAIRAQVSASHD